jgi:hypothetical protein
MTRCKAELRHPLTDEVLLSCDLDDVADHTWHADKLTGAEWRYPFVGVAINRHIVKVPPKVYEYHPDPYERVKVTIDA